MQLMQKLSEATKPSSELITTAASLLFYTITTLKKYAPDEELRVIFQEQSRELVKSVHKEIVRWMQKVYGNIFGGTDVYMLLCANEELEVSFRLIWKLVSLSLLTVLCLQFCQSLYKLDCPQHIQELWQPAILQTINKRIKRVVCDYCFQIFRISYYINSQPLSKRIDLFCVLESQKAVDSNIATLFTEAVMESIHQMVSIGT